MFQESSTPLAPLPPSGVETHAEGTSLIVSWTPPSDSGTSATTSYTAVVIPGGASCSVNAPSTTCTISNLVPGTYTATVTATNAVGTSDPSSPPAPATIATGVKPSNLAATGAPLEVQAFLALALFGFGAVARRIRRRDVLPR